MLRKLKQRIEGMMYRDLELRVDAIIDADERTIRVVASTEFAVLRKSFFAMPWLETLGHKRGEVDLSRLKNGAPVLYNHNAWSRADRIGVVESATLNSKDKRIDAVIRISKRDDVNDIWQDIKDKVLRNISVGYSVNERVLTREGKGEPDEFRITSWTPAEISLVAIGADPKAQVGARNLGDNMQYRIFDIENERSTGQMFTYDSNGNPIGDTPETRAAILAGTATRKDGSPYVPTDEVRAQLKALDTPAIAAVPAPAPATVIPLTDADKEAARKEGEQTGRDLELSRRNDIEALFVPFGDKFDTIRAAAIKDGTDVEATRTLLLDAMGKDSEPAGGDAVRIELGDDATDKFVRAGTMAIAVRAGHATKEEREEVGKTGFRGFTLYELARRALTMSGQNADRFGKLELVGRAFTTSDFPLLLQDAANKSMLRGWDEAPETWAEWMNTGELSDFKVGNMVNLSSFESLSLVNEDGEFTYGSFQDEGQTIQLATYGKLFSISRQAIINDDLNAFTRIPAGMGRAASRTVGDVAYGVLTANANLSDGVALFAGTAIGTLHGNLDIGGGAAIAVASVDAARVGMARQSDVSGEATALGIRPAHFVVPVALEGVAKVLMASEFDPADGTNNNRAPNSVRGIMKVVSEVRLDIADPAAWYLAANGDTIQVAFLDGQQAPVLEQQMGWSIDGSEYKVRIDVAAAAEDFRGLQRNDGA